MEESARKERRGERGGTNGEGKAVDAEEDERGAGEDEEPGLKDNARNDDNEGREEQEA